MPKPKRVALYLRVSTADQTVENQRIDLVRVAEQRGWRIVEEYVDHGISGAKGREKRPGFDRLCRDASHGKFDLIASWAIDRVGRSLAHLVSFIEDLREWNVGLYLHQQSIDSSTPSGRAMLQMCGVFAEFERSILVERINAGLARARAQGRRTGRPPISAEIEHRIRELRGKGFGKLRIARELHCGVGSVSRVLAAA